jgi:hypothetical protein
LTTPNFAHIYSNKIARDFCVCLIDDGKIQPQNAFILQRQGAKAEKWGEVEEGRLMDALGADDDGEKTDGWMDVLLGRARLLHCCCVVRVSSRTD